MRLHKSKIIVFMLCFVFLAIGMLSFSYAEGNKSDSESTTNEKISEDQEQLPISSVDDETSVNSAVYMEEDSITSDVYVEPTGLEYTITVKTLDDGTQIEEDLYHLTKQDVETVFKNGHTIQDLFMADKLGNRLRIPPLKLLEKKRELKLDWPEFEEQIKQEKMEEVFMKIKGETKGKKVGLTIQNEIQTLSEVDKLILLSLVDKKNEAHLEKIKNYMNQHPQTDQGILNLVQKHKEVRP